MRQVAESFGIDADRYDRARPAYPDELIQRVVAASPGTDFLDVGCGTGIGARQYRASGINVLGVDVDTRMAEFARETGIEVEIGKFEEWDSRGRSFDAVVAGQAWHWVDPVLGAGKAAQVLRPHGLLALYWHVFDPPAEIADPFEKVLGRVAPDGPLKTPASSFNNAISAGPWTVYTPPAASVNPSSGDSNGSGTTPAMNGWTIWPPPVSSPCSHRSS